MYFATRPTISVFKLYYSIYKCQFQQMLYSKTFARMACNHRFAFKPNMREWDLKIQPIIISPSSNQDTVSFTPRIKDQLHIGYHLPRPSGSWCCNLPLINPLFTLSEREKKKLLSIITFSIHIELLTFRCLGLRDHWKSVKEFFTPRDECDLILHRLIDRQNNIQIWYHKVIALMKNNYIYWYNLSPRCYAGYFKRKGLWWQMGLIVFYSDFHFADFSQYLFTIKMKAK